MAELVLPESPSREELVIGVVKRIERFGAYLDLAEYPGWEGFVHISEISLKWVRNIRDYLREGQREVFKVLRVNPHTKQVDLSLRRVGKNERTEKLLEWKRRQKVLRVIRILAERTGKDEGELRKAIAGPAAQKGLELYEVFLEAVEFGRLPEWMRLEPRVAEALLQLIKQEIKLKKVALKAVLILTSKRGDGVELVRKAVEEGLKIAGKGESISITTLGAPRYLLRVEADDGERAREVLRQAAAQCIKVMEEGGGSGQLVEK